MAKVLIAGCGYLGSELAKILVENKHQVTAIKRTSGNLPEGVEEFIADLRDAKSLGFLASDFDHIFFTAAAKEHSKEAYKGIYLDGFKNLLAALEKNKSNTKSILFSSSTSVYAQNDGSWVDEDSETNPNYFSGKVILEAEAMLEKSSFRSSSVRFGGLYGPGRTRLIRSVIEQQTTLSTSSEYTNRIHIIDAARLLFHLMNSNTLEKTYIGVDCAAVEKNEVLNFIANSLKLSISESKETKPHQLRSNKRCSNSKILSTGFKFKYPTYKDGYGEMLS